MQPYKDDIDQLFQEGLSSGNIPFDESAWIKMEKRLDAADTIAFAYWKLIYPLAVILVIVLAIWLWPGTSDNAESAPPVVTENIETHNNTDANPSSANNESSTTPEIGAKEKESYKQAPEEEDNAETDTTTLTESLGPSKISAENTDEPDVVRATVSENEATENSPSFTGGGEEYQSRFGGDLKILEGLDWMALDGYRGGEVEMTEVPMDTTREEVIKKSKLLFGLTVSNDWSAVGVSEFTNSGPSIGAIVEYLVLKRISVLAGASIGSRKYSAVGEEYWRPRWMDRSPGNEINTIAANCRVVDIPVNIYYHFAPKGLNQFSIGSGISSYLMLREDYAYTYNFADPNLPDTWVWENRNKHYFGVYNLSVVYRRQLSDKLYLGVEPYFKIPLTEIGIGEVDLYSFGTTVSLKFKK